MQPSYDSWDFEPGDMLDMSFGSGLSSKGLSDISKGKGKYGGPPDYGVSKLDSWDSWGSSDTGMYDGYKGSLNNGKGSFGSPGGKPISIRGPYAPTLSGKGGEFRFGEASKGSLDFGGPLAKAALTKSSGAPVAKVIPPRIQPGNKGGFPRPGSPSGVVPPALAGKGPPGKGSSLMQPAPRLPNSGKGCFKGPGSCGASTFPGKGGSNPPPPASLTTYTPPSASAGLARPPGPPGGVRPPLPALPAPGAAPTGLAPELAALAVAEGSAEGKALLVDTKKPRIILLATRLAPDLQENHMQQILEQCGEVHAWRRARGAAGEPLSFGFVQFGDPEAAWKASTCLAKRVLCGHEMKILVEESAEALIKKWRDSQKAALKVSTDDELEWELERKAVSCKALIDTKMEEIYGPPEDGSPGACAQRRQELREREQARVKRVRKRKAWRETEYAQELAGVEKEEKRLRREEREADDQDRVKEEAEMREKVETDLKAAKLDELGVGHTNLLTNVSLADSRAICDTVDHVQAESRNNIFRMELDTGFLRDEKIIESKLRPWLERKIDFFMGGPQSDLVEYILRRVNGASNPESLINDLSRFLDEGAEPVVERMWRMLVFEAVRAGKLSLEPPSRK